MKTKLFTVLCLFFGVAVLGAQNHVITFKVDMSSLEVKNLENVGIRGSDAPLSWDKTYPMTDPDGDGVYTCTIEFDDIMPGSKLFYKFVYGDVVWENDLYAEAGNRSLYMMCNYYEAPVVKWNIIDDFSQEALLFDSDLTVLYHWLFIIGNGMQRGLTTDSIGKEYAAFFIDDYDWLTRPVYWMANARLGQEASPYGHFEEINVTHNVVEYKLRKVWGQYIQRMGKKGKLKGITEKEMTSVLMSFSETIISSKGWTYDWTEKGEYITIKISK